MPIKSWIFATIIVLIAGAALYGVHALTASTAPEPIQHVPVQSADGNQQRFAQGATYQVCFTPGNNCESMIVRAINASSRSIHVQAYVLTDEGIARALKDASRRNLEVIVLLDKRARSQRGSVAPELIRAVLKVLFDDRPAAAHNKTILIDPGSANPVVETGSFNFTYSAERRNAENALIVRGDPGLASAYERYFQERLTVSERWERGD
jgi:phosphatidylserine/phosphatidylglycerophosphate/cardiolipin synthase-like enzyme